MATPRLHSRAELDALADRSHDVIATHQHPGGAYPASPTFSAYRGYAWFRDGAFVAEGMSRYGDRESAEAFHDWAARVLVTRADRVDAVAVSRRTGQQIPTGALLATRFTLDGEDGSDPWWDFQTDGFGTWLWALAEHCRRHGVDPARWTEGVQVAARYLLAVGDLPCYDWWEEHSEHVHASSLAAVSAGLRAAAALLPDSDLARDAGAGAELLVSRVLAQATTSGRATDPRAVHLAKWVGSAEVDASLAACVVPFAVVEPGSALATATLDAIGRDLDVDGGVHRFRADVFYGGGQWPLLSCLLGWNLLAAGDRVGAERHLAWALATATPGGDLPEQVPDHLLHPEHRPEWLERWGPVATPLLWSHGMVLILADALAAEGAPA